MGCMPVGTYNIKIQLKHASLEKYCYISDVYNL